MSTIIMVMSVALVAALIVTEHLLLARVLAHNETARRVIGVGTVLACAAIPVFASDLDWRPFAVVCVLFAVAGGVMLAIETVERAVAHVTAVEREREDIAATRGQ